MALIREHSIVPQTLRKKFGMAIIGANEAEVAGILWITIAMNRKNDQEAIQETPKQMHDSRILDFELAALRRHGVRTEGYGLKTSYIT